MKQAIQYAFFLMLCLIFSSKVNSQTSSLVSVGTNGKLVYAADAKGNTVPDFSGVGYMNSESPIPNVAVVKTVTPVVGDNLQNVQSAINEVALMPADANGFRGAILFKAGIYNVSDTIQIRTSGIVLRGEGFNGTGTNFIATKTSPSTLFNFAGLQSTSSIGSTRKAITNNYVPFGAKQVTVAAGHTFAVGDKVFVHRIPNAAWINLLGMDTLTRIDPLAVNWTASAYDMNSERKVTGVNGNIISLDAPIMDIIDSLYATGELIKFNSFRIEKCGIENMRISSVYASETDENHAWEAITFDNIINAWAKNIEAYYFAYSAVHILDGASWVTVDSSKMYDAKSIVDGGRRYSFDIDGQRCLVQNCITRNGRHDFVNGSRTCGPNVFYNCSATLQYNDIGPHHRWSTGILYDNIFCNGRIDVQNRLASGSGHGWAGGQIMYWNCTAARMVVQDPKGDAVNWAIGCVSPEITNVGDMTTEPLGFVESQGTKILNVTSLYQMQLNERMEPLRRPQTISFGTLASKFFGDADFDAGAIASSGLTVSYTSSNTAVATIVNGLIHIAGAGSAIITSTQSGNLYYLSAPNVSQTLTVNPASQTITFGVLAAKVFGNADFSAGATASSGLTVSYTSSNTAVATIVNGLVRIVGVGTSTITASQSGNANYSAATNVLQTLTVNKASQTITFGALPAKVFGNADFSAGATASSGLTVTYTSSNTAVATIVSGLIRIIGVGTSTITASQSGNTNYNAATNVLQTLIVSKASQTITFPALPAKVVGDADFSGGATASSALAITYSSSNTAVATIVSGNIRIVAAGTAVITASQSGNTNYNAATSVSQTLAVGAATSFNYSPSATTITSGRLSTGVVGNMATNNSSYYVVSSTTSGTRVLDWYGSVKITQAPASVTQLTINYDGKNSASKTQVLYLYNWVTAAWVQINSRTVTTTDIAITNTQTAPANYISSLGEIRLRVYSRGGISNYTCSADWMQFVVKTSGVARPVSNSVPNNTIKIISNAKLFPNPAHNCAAFNYELTTPVILTAEIFDNKSRVIKTLFTNQPHLVGSYTKQIDLSEFNSGVYYLNIGAHSFIKTIKFIIVK